MEFTTPASYASTVVRVAGIATDGKLLFANTDGNVKHIETKKDSDNDWPEPTSASYHWVGKTEDGKDVTADLSGALGAKLDRIDVMAEVPWLHQDYRSECSWHKAVHLPVSTEDDHQDQDWG